jgi:transcriptional regulator with XRE-family HTH domain
MQQFSREEVKNARELAGLSQRDLARLAGVSQSRISTLESATVPDRVAVALNTALAERLGC